LRLLGQRGIPRIQDERLRMQPQTIQRQYDEVVAPHYDEDAQSVTGPSLDRALAHLLEFGLLDDSRAALKVLDVGVGTGLFLAKLLALGGDRVEPFGLDLSPRMVEGARRKVPQLVAAIDDAANLDAHFLEQSFDLVCTHFITGYVPMGVLAPKIHARLEEGGYWSLVGGTKAGWPALQAKARSRLLCWLCGGRTFSVDDLASNPAGRDEVVRTLELNGFAVRAAETFEPALKFRNFEEFMTFAYHGGWLTPFLESLGLHKAGALTKWLLNLFFFPVEDHHSIEIVLAQKVTPGRTEGQG
jgi:SAM-dependent methyltransferase